MFVTVAEYNREGFTIGRSGKQGPGYLSNGTPIDGRGYTQSL